MNRQLLLSFLLLWHFINDNVSFRSRTTPQSSNALLFLSLVYSIFVPSPPPIERFFHPHSLFFSTPFSGVLLCPRAAAATPIFPAPQTPSHHTWHLYCQLASPAPLQFPVVSLINFPIQSTDSVVLARDSVVSQSSFPTVQHIGYISIA